MHPITLRIPNNLLSEIESEADELGYSSRAEYIRQLLQNRAHAREALSTDDTKPVVDPEIVESNSEQIETIVADVDAMMDRIKQLEQQLEATEKTDDGESSQDRSSTGAADGTRAEPSTPMDDLETWLENDGPQSDNAVAIIREAATILRDDGPLNAAELKERLYVDYPDAYDSKDAMWASTVERLYEDAPGFNKPSYGTYAFD